MTKVLRLKVVLCIVLLMSVLLTACSVDPDPNKDPEATTTEATTESTTTNGDNAETPEIKTTVANADEWYSVFAIDNFSYKSVTTSEGSVIDEAEALFDSGNCVITDKAVENDNIPVTFYRVRIGDMWYDLDTEYSIELSEQNIGVCDQYFITIDYSLPMASMFKDGDIKGAFSEATYDETKKAYLYSYSEHISYEEIGIEFNYSYEFEFYIQNKKLVKVNYKYNDDDIAYSGVETFYNIGKTNIENMPKVVFVGIPENILDSSHEWTVDSNSIVPATGCDGIGTVKFVCSDCQETITLNYINGHSDEMHTSYILAEGSDSCEDGGYRVEKCSICDGVKEKYLAGNMHFVSEINYCNLSGYDVCEHHEVGVTECACGASEIFFFDDETSLSGGDYSCDECSLRVETRLIGTDTVGDTMVTSFEIAVFCGGDLIAEYTISYNMAFGD